MIATLNVIQNTLKRNWRTLMLWGLASAILFQILMMFALIVRFQALPNYVSFYDWIGNVVWIVKSTPSWSDIPGIVAEEWLIEIGKMNYDYGNGISEWSLNVVPSRLVVLFFLGCLIGLTSQLAKDDSCGVSSPRSMQFGTGIGAVLVAMTNATMSWVVCCATPSWVVGLAMLGLGVSTSLALETLGPLLTGAGFGILLAMIMFLAWRKTRQPETMMEMRHA